MFISTCLLQPLYHFNGPILVSFFNLENFPCESVDFYFYFTSPRFSVYFIVRTTMICIILYFFNAIVWIYSFKEALCQMLGYSPYESSLAPIICMVGAILFAQK